MPGRKFGTLGRFGFNGKEQDPELKGEGTQYDYGFRIYDPRIAKFLSVDPLAKNYPWYSPYHFAGNQPIVAIDLDGAEPQWFQDLMEFLGAGPKKIESEVESTRRITTNQSDFKSALPDSKDGGPGGIAREIIINNQFAKDYSNAADYFSRPYKITNFIAGVVYAPAGGVTGAGNISQGNIIEGTIDILTLGNGGKIRAGENIIEKGGGNVLSTLVKAPVDVVGWLEKAGVKSINLLKGSKGGKVAVIGQGMDKVKQVAEALKNPEIFKPTKAAQDVWNDLLKAYEGKQIPDEVVKGTQIYKENVKWIEEVKKAGYDILDTGGGNTSTFYNMEKQAVYGTGAKKP